MLAARHLFTPALALITMWLGLMVTTACVADATRIESVPQYDARLAQAEAALRRMERSNARPLKSVLDKLEKSSDSVQVRRGDGKTQPAASEQWHRIKSDIEGNATRAQVRQAIEAVAARRRALAVWAGTTANLEPVGAQAMVQQLEATGQIRTGPTQIEQFISDAKKWFKSTIKAFFDWVGGLFPSNPNAQPPKINWTVVAVIFWATVVALLLVIIYLVWKAIGGRWGRAGARRLMRFEGSEDTELLILPPDELRERARRLAAEGNFREALRHLYIALLLTLDARGVWHYDTRRTNWEHIAALRHDPARVPIVAPLSDLTRRFDRVRYGNAECNNDDWTRFERDVAQLEQSTPMGQSTPASLSPSNS